MAQFGVEVLSPDCGTNRDESIALAATMVGLRTTKYQLARSIKRGLDYHTADGFALGAQKQLVGGGTYPQGVGFAVGVDRLMLCRPAPSQGKQKECATCEK
jgi:histidyl-tRNA synthetase